jgi:hypothetical protein
MGLAFAWIALRRFSLTPVLLVAVFACETVYSYDQYLRRDIGSSTLARFESVAPSLPHDEHPVAFNWDDFDVNLFYVMQYWLRPHRYLSYSLARGESPEASMFISVRCPLKVPDCDSAFERHQMTNAPHSLWLKRPQPASADAN